MVLSKEESAVRAWASRLVRVFGITPKGYHDIIKLQGNRCPICGKPPPEPGERRWPVDHNHKTGEVRGIPCGFCNHKRIGQWTDVEMLKRVVDYMEHPPARRYFGRPLIVPGHGKRKPRKRPVQSKARRPGTK